MTPNGFYIVMPSGGGQSALRAAHCRHAVVTTWRLFTTEPITAAGELDRTY